MTEIQTKIISLSMFMLGLIFMIMIHNFYDWFEKKTNCSLLLPLFTIVALALMIIGLILLISSFDIWTGL